MVQWIVGGGSSAVAASVRGVATLSTAIERQIPGDLRETDSRRFFYDLFPSLFFRRALDDGCPGGGIFTGLPLSQGVPRDLVKRAYFRHPLMGAQRVQLLRYDSLEFRHRHLMYLVRFVLF